MIIKYTRINDIVNIITEDCKLNYKPIDSEIVQKWIAEGNTIEPEFTDAELLAQENATKVSEAKQYLSSTDWVVVKINEANINGEDISELSAKYADVLTARADARAAINSIE